MQEIIQVSYFKENSKIKLFYMFAEIRTGNVHGMKFSLFLRLMHDPQILSRK